MDSRTDGGIEGWTDRGMEGWTDGMDGQPQLTWRLLKWLSSQGTSFTSSSFSASSSVNRCDTPAPPAPAPPPACALLAGLTDLLPLPLSPAPGSPAAPPAPEPPPPRAAAAAAPPAAGAGLAYRLAGLCERAEAREGGGGGRDPLRDERGRGVVTGRGMALSACAVGGLMAEQGTNGMSPPGEGLPQQRATSWAHLRALMS